MLLQVAPGSGPKLWRLASGTHLAGAKLGKIVKNSVVEVD
jgi:hypothetical protein